MSCRAGLARSDIGEEHVERGRGVVCEELDERGVLEISGISWSQMVDESGEVIVYRATGELGLIIEEKK